jgi:hypothetical protein
MTLKEKKDISGSTKDESINQNLQKKEAVLKGRLAEISCILDSLSLNKTDPSISESASL